MTRGAFILDPQAFADIYGEECRTALRQHAGFEAPVTTTAEVRENPPAWLAETEVLFTGWGGPRLDEAMLARMPRLRVVFYGAGSVRPIATDALWRRGITVCSAAALNAQPVIEYTVGAILLSFKRAWHQDRMVRANRTYIPLHGVPSVTGFGPTVGLVSLGLIGRGVAERLRSYDVNLLAYDPTLSAQQAADAGARLVALPELFQQSDIISLHTPLLPETTGLVGEKLLGGMKPNATLINTARGGLIVESDLLRVLQARPDLQAIIDVLDPEPPAAESIIYRLPNIFLTPHVAGSIGRECRRMGCAMVEEFGRYQRGEPLRYAVDSRQFSLIA